MYNSKALWPSIFLVALSTFGIGVLSLAPRSDDKVLGVFFSPSTHQDRSLAAIIKAGARPISKGYLPGMFIAEAKDKDFAERVTKQGALFVFRANVAWGCSPNAQN